jgi:hypothetical protein
MSGFENICDPYAYSVFLNKYSKYYNNGHFYTKDAEIFVDICCDLLPIVNDSTVEDIKKVYDLRKTRWLPYLYIGSIGDIKGSLTKYLFPAELERNFKSLQLEPWKDQFNVTLVRIISNYSTHMDVTYMCKSRDDYFIYGIVPPYEGSLKIFVKNFDWSLKKIYEHGDSEVEAYFSQKKRINIQKNNEISLESTGSSMSDLINKVKSQIINNK